MVDVSVFFSMSIAGITGMSEAGRRWIRHNVESESWQQVGATIYADSRFASAIVDGMASDGLSVEVDGMVLAI